jgi:hypothetical protein
MFAGFNFADVFWFIVALVVDTLFALWVSRNVVVRETTTPDPDTRRGRAAAQTTDSRSARRPQQGQPATPDSTTTPSAQ